MRICTFCGHSKLSATYTEVKGALQSIVPGLIQDGYDYFLVGNYGQFDRLAASVCLTLRRDYPSIVVNLVVPYYQPQLDSYEKEYRARFDDVIVPALEGTPYQYRIVRANEYMVGRADTIVAYVNTPIGGAAKTLAYAERKKKRIIHVEIESDNSNI